MVAELSSQGAIPAATVADAVAGDAMAFARIVRTHHDDMVRVCQLICGDAELAQDATQSAWPIVWRKLGSLREPDKLRPWLVSIAANEARQMIRRLHRDRVVPIEIADIRSDQGDPAWRSTDDDLISAIRRLPEEDRTLIALRYVSGFDATEIAPILGLSPSGVRTRLSRVVARLRQEVER
jgi:RNA polymerase sigma-70 factor (ECF subfamily)